MTDIDTVADSIFASFKAYCSAEVQRRMTAALRELPPGPQGERGLPGERGEPGERGAPGPAGVDGINGKDGRDGLDGKDGAAGIAGKDGRDGIDGKDGAAGLRGADGKDGAAGLAGKDGHDGVDGKEGAAGLRGADGKVGAAGLAGKDGRDGIDGKDGAAGLRGGDGKDGAAGLAGKDGRDGIDGKDGTSGRDGLKGEDGRDGRDGLEGAPGRDALRLDVLDAVDRERSYPRGTYVKHDGGLMRSIRTTDPLLDGELGAAGWQIVVEGINDVQFIAADERTTKLCLAFTGGRTVEHVLQFPVVIYRGLWSPGAYQRGDAVTCGGSVWHCERATDAKPELSGDWKLMVKRGRDGDRGEPGPDGKAPPRVQVGGGR